MTRLPLAALVLALAQPAEAMDYSLRTDHGHVVIEASGEIEPNEKERFFDFLASLPTDTLLRITPKSGAAIIFNSRGGWVAGGYNLAQAIEGMKINTGVAKGGQCSSACVMAWAAGQRKSTAAGACVGVHQGAPRGTAEQAATASAAEITDFMAHWLDGHGAPETVLVKMKMTPSSAITCISAADLAAWGAAIIKDKTQ